ncbi:hypothetical protein ACVWZ6_000073 [Bradyrhizobium sp. GM6.1]
MKIWRIFERLAHWVALLLGIVAIVAIGVIIGHPAEKSGNQPNFAGAEQQQKRLAVFLDGTWNSVDSNTNVWRMRALCASKGRDGKPQLVYYSVGVNGFLGGVFGQGLDENIRLAYEWLIENYNDGDEIYIFGFSRGAYTARALAGLIAIDGILKAGSPIGVSELFERYRKGDEESIWTLKDKEAAGDVAKLTEQERWLLKYAQPTKIKVIGVWDTVGSVGLAAGNIPGISRSSFDYLQTGLRLPILNGYHALAIDEHRNDFVPTLWDVTPSKRSEGHHRAAATALRRRATLVCGRPRQRRWRLRDRPSRPGTTALDDEKGRIAGTFVSIRGRLGGKFGGGADHRFLQALRLRDVRQVHATALPVDWPRAGCPRRREAHQHKRDDRRQRVWALARRSRVSSDQSCRMGTTQESRPGAAADVRAGRRSSFSRARPIVALDFDESRRSSGEKRTC